MKYANKSKHLTIEDRTVIQECLSHGISFKHIAKRIGKDPTTVSKEVKRNMQFTSDCRKLNAKGEEIACPCLLRAPFVCNGCSKYRTGCGFKKQVYYASHAQKTYENTLVESRKGIPLNKQSFYDLDDFISSGILKRQHLYHINESNKFNVSLSTIYRYFNKGYFSASPCDLPRKVSFKPRKKKREQYVPTKHKVGRTYADFNTFIEKFQVLDWLEMDTVIGTPGGKTLLTFNFTKFNFFFARLLERKTAMEVVSKINEIKESLKQVGILFEDLFPVILTDNGCEFGNFEAIEENHLNLFYCDPYSSWQKPHIEKSHTELRDILPKGSSFEKLTQEKVDVICSHINNAKKKSLNGKSSYEMFVFTFGEEITKALGIKHIKAEEVVQTKALMKDLNK